MTGLTTFGLILCSLLWLPASRAAPEPRPELVKPGRTAQSELRGLLGRPLQVVREGSREYQFYRLGGGSTMDATVALKSGVVEYVTYLCSQALSAVKERFAGEEEVLRSVRAKGVALRGAMSQIMYPGRGQGFLFEPKTKRVKACVAWEPGRKLEELGLQ